MRLVLIFAVAMGVSACQSASSIASATGPEWFETRREALAGSDYPDLERVSKQNFEANSLAPWASMQRDLARAQRAMIAETGPVDFVSAEEMRAWAREQQRLVAQGEEPY